jgi:hypothetical protein
MKIQATHSPATISIIAARAKLKANSSNAEAEYNGRI